MSQGDRLAQGRASLRMMGPLTRVGLAAVGLLMVVGCASTEAQPTPPPGSRRPASTIRADTTPAASLSTLSSTQSVPGSPEDEARVARALDEVFGDPLSGAKCRSIADARQAAGAVLTEFGLSDWTINVIPYAREDGCAVAGVPWSGQVDIHTTYRPEVRDVLEAFRDHSLEECLDAKTATRELTAALEAIGHTRLRREAGRGFGRPQPPWG